MVCSRQEEHITTMVSSNWMLLAALLCCMLVADACSKHSPTSFSQLYRSDFGLELAFDMSQADVQAVLGQPQASNKIQYGASVSDSYLPKGVSVLDGDTPQLTLTYFDGKLARLYNRWNPADEKAEYPPYFIELLPGIKLGNRKSDIVAALGQPENREIYEWEFEHKDGRLITIVAHFTAIPNTADELMSSLLVVLVPAIPELKGEEIDAKDDWKKDVGLE